MKRILKVGAGALAVVSVWVALLLSPNLPHSFALLLPYLPVYAVMALGCYGLGAVGYGLMVFPTCPHEAELLQKDIYEAREFYGSQNVDVGLG
ncbi:unnamed protein product [Calypogeia fissa]